MYMNFSVSIGLAWVFLVKVWNLCLRILTPTITAHHLSQGTWFSLLFKLCQNLTWNLIGFYVSSGSQDEILEGGILLHPVTLMWLCWQNFWLVPGHTVISMHIPRFPELMFHTRTWMHPQWCYPPSWHTACSSSRSWKLSTPDPISCL